MTLYVMGRSFTAELGKQVCTYKLYLIFGVSLALVLIAFSQFRSPSSNQRARRMSSSS
ncbi:hypothetical protein ACFQMM_04790 [Saliphagus sp. GCM10025308]